MTSVKSTKSKSSVVSLKDVEFRWPGKAGFGLAVDELEVGRGERVLLLGPSGSGKSTLLNLLCGIVVPDTGQITLLDQDIAAMSASARDRFRAEHLGIIFQMFNLLPYANAVENVLLPLGFAPDRCDRAGRNNSAKEEAVRLLSELGIDGALSTYTQASHMSIGQQQRVAAARALIGEPAIIVADEPTSALDDDAQERFLDLVLRQLDVLGSTLLMVSHDQRIAGRFDRTVRMDEFARPLESVLA